ncbi:MAG: DUF3127 domain-containing protein [Muribaculaceae bacterium]|nr:DUF3127 domain-containing protein [Muribaculaceae bacterium]
MEIEGKIIQELPMQSGTSKAGNPWKKREWVLETFGSYPRKVKFHVFGDRSDTIGIEVGNSYTLSFDLESREFNGRWYTDVSVYQARPMGAGNEQQPGGFQQPGMQGGYGQPGGYQQPGMGMGMPGGNAPTFQPGSADAGDDLPF